VLIGVLWSLFFLSALALAIYAYVAPQIGLIERLNDRHRLYYSAQAGVKRAMAVMGEDETESYDALNDAWSNNEEAFKEIELGDEGYFSVGYDPGDGDSFQEGMRYGLVDEERKLNINKAPFEVLKQFFKSVGETTAQEADEIVDAILDWIDADDEPRGNGAEEGYYASLQPPYACKNKEFQALEELLLVKAMTQEIFDKVKGHVTIYSSGTVNLNTAGKPVLQALGMSAGLAEKVLHFRKGPDGREVTKDDNIFESVEVAGNALGSAESLSPEETNQFDNAIATGLVSVRSDNFQGTSLGMLRDKAVLRKIVFIFDRGKTVKYWRED
jgi:general secretion pathway protein K